MPDAFTVAIEAVATAEAPRRRRPGAAPPNVAPFAQHVAAFYPYPNPQDAVVRSASEGPAENRGPAAASRSAGLARRRNGRDGS